MLSKETEATGVTAGPGIPIGICQASKTRLLIPGTGTRSFSSVNRPQAGSLLPWLVTLLRDMSAVRSLTRSLYRQSLLFFLLPLRLFPAPDVALSKLPFNGSLLAIRRIPQLRTAGDATPWRFLRDETTTDEHAARSITMGDLLFWEGWFIGLCLPTETTRHLNSTTPFRHLG